jgi:hypothetical protein
MIVKQFVIETLRDSKIRRINFRYGPIRVYPEGYQRDIAEAVEHEHIGFLAAAGNPYYTAERLRGQQHIMALPAEHIELNSNTPNGNAGILSVKANLGQLGGAGLRGTIVHEATHALQDYQRNQTDAKTAEGAAYLAGWMASLLWGYPRLMLPGGGVPSTAQAYARWLAGLRLDGRIGYEIPKSHVDALNGLVALLLESADGYVFNGI